MDKFNFLDQRGLAIVLKKIKEELIGLIPQGSSAQTVIDYIQELDEEKIASIVINGKEIKSESGVIEMPLAAEDIYGLVKGSSGNDEISIAPNGNMEVNSLNINKIYQEEGDSLVLSGEDI